MLEEMFSSPKTTLKSIDGENPRIWCLLFVLLSNMWPDRIQILNLSPGATWGGSGLESPASQLTDPLTLGVTQLLGALLSSSVRWE